MNHPSIFFNRPVFLIFMITCVILPAVCNATYLIELKTGASFITRQYWEEGEKVQFTHSGGVVGVSRDMIHKIIKSDDPVPVEIIPVIPQTTDTETPSTENRNKKAGYVDKNSPEFWQKEQQLKSILNHLNNDILTQRQYFQTAKDENDTKAKNQAWKELIQLNNKKGRLKKRVMNFYGGILPKWWSEDG